ADALYVCVDPVLNARRISINTLANVARLPTITGLRGVRRSGKSDVLWTERSGPVSARRRLCRQDFARRQAGRASGRAAHQIRARRQSDHGQGARSGDPGAVPAARRRVDRMKRREAFSPLGGLDPAWGGFRANASAGLKSISGPRALAAAVFGSTA